MLIAINFHYVRPVFDYPHPGIHGITPVQLELQLALLSHVGKFISGVDLRAAIREGRPVPEKSFVVTFDDGLKEQYDFAWPVLKRMGIPAVFFINTRPIETSSVSMVHKIHLLRAHIAPKDFLAMLQEQAREQGVNLELGMDQDKAAGQYRYDTPEAAQLKYLLNFTLSGDERDKLVDSSFQSFFPKQEASISRKIYMDFEEIHELGASGNIGTHAHEHLPLGLLSDAAIRDNICLSLACLESWTGQKPFALSYPYGSKEACSQETARMAQNLGIHFAFTMERAANQDLTRPLFLARFDNNDLPGGKSSKWTKEELFQEAPHASWYS